MLGKFLQRQRYSFSSLNSLFGRKQPRVSYEKAQQLYETLKQQSSVDRLIATQKKYLSDKSDDQAAGEYIKELLKAGRVSAAHKVASDFLGVREEPKIIELKNYTEDMMHPWPDYKPFRPKNPLPRFFKYSLLFTLGVGTYIYLNSTSENYQQIDRNRSAAEALSATFTSRLIGTVEMEKDVKTRFSDVVGIDEFKEDLIEIVRFLKNPKKYRDSGATLPKGVLLSGPPGTGKTLMARALAGESGCTFFYKAGSEFDEMYVGVGAQRVKQLFAEARKHAPSIIFIDEFDSVGGKRKANSPSYTRDAINQLLSEIDGFKSTDNVIVVAATNFAEAVDPAVKRPGRFDRIVEVQLPDARGRKEILNYYLNKIKISPDVLTDNLVKRTTGFSGADIKNLVNTSILHAVRNERQSASESDFEFALDRIRMGVGRKNMAISAEERRLTAIHEMGHALTSLLTEGAIPLHKVTILPRGPSLGVTSMVPEKETLNYTKKTILAMIDVSMGGRVAEQLFCGKDKITTGAGADLKGATQYAYRYVKYFGMNESVNLSSPPQDAHMSDEFNSNIDREVDRLLKESYSRVFRLLSRNKESITKVVDVLVEEETLTAEQVRKILHM